MAEQFECWCMRGTGSGGGNIHFCDLFGGKTSVVKMDSFLLGGGGISELEKEARNENDTNQIPLINCSAAEIDHTY